MQAASFNTKKWFDTRDDFIRDVEDQVETKKENSYELLQFNKAAILLIARKPSHRIGLLNCAKAVAI